MLPKSYFTMVEEVLKSGLYDRVKSALEKENIEVIELGGVKPNPRLSLVKEGIKLCKEH